ncbi:hypothetical protein KEX41_29455 (plasmid) [Burkholderia thailandensis]|uniref:hypothetical protein n=1 Tax=Burkholderia thailandensis TaxID=57975 RepID=UPI00192D49D4|nr:hypothetical protein [Burkholderia thailandensis]MBS2132310.1 hypothetical protein [Burkholderia thailandensis]QRA15119.1 hypothetical protein JMY07_29880 [Burkholderia thailandensis]
MYPKFTITELAPGIWALSHVTSVGASAGRTTYPSAEIAAQVARDRDPHAEIEIRALAH